MPKWSAFRKISLPHLHGKNVNPHYPLEVWSAFEQKTEKFLISLPISEKFIRIEPPLT